MPSLGVRSPWSIKSEQSFFTQTITRKFQFQGRVFLEDRYLLASNFRLHYWTFGTSLEKRGESLSDANFFLLQVIFDEIDAYFYQLNQTMTT